MEGRDEVRADFQKGFLQKTTQEWLDILLAEDIWCAPVNDFAAVEHDPQIAENEMIVEWEHPSADTVRSTGVAVKFDETPGGIPGRLPCWASTRRSCCVSTADIPTTRSRGSLLPGSSARTQRESRNDHPDRDQLGSPARPLIRWWRPLRPTCDPIGCPDRLGDAEP